jgi:DNA-binding winged helix-turn-helix (wHTH) protein
LKQFASFVLDTANECLWREGEKISLQPKRFAVLRYLVENPGRLIPHRELLAALWPDTYVQPQVLRTYMLELRRILGDDPVHPRFIETLPKRGYCFVAPVSDAVTPAESAALPAADADGPATRDAELVRLAAELLERALRVVESRNRPAEAILTLRQALAAECMAAAGDKSSTTPSNFDNSLTRI